eukprot:scaffold23118_cov140-Isochrysis_galbana.AAC.2
MRALPATAPAAPPPPLTPDNLALALRGALSPAADVRVPYEAALQAWEAAPGLYASALLKVYESNAAAGGAGGGVPEPERLLAVLCLKAVVNRRWNERRPGDAALSDSEKADVRARLLRACDEKEGALAAQVRPGDTRGPGRAPTTPGGTRSPGAAGDGCGLGTHWTCRHGLD